MSDYTIKFCDRLPVCEPFEFFGVISSKIGPIDAGLYPSCDWKWIEEAETPNNYLFYLTSELRKKEGFSYKDVYELMSEADIYGFSEGRIYHLGACDAFEAVCSIRILADGGRDD